MCFLALFPALALILRPCCVKSESETLVEISLIPHRVKMSLTFETGQVNVDVVLLVVYLFERAGICGTISLKKQTEQNKTNEQKMAKAGAWLVS